jgi:hypothetical protein
VQIADVYRLPSREGKLLPGTLAICNVDRVHWVGCRVVQVGATGASVIDVNETHYWLPWSQVLPPSALTELNLKRHFDTASELRDFERDMAKAGPPRVVPGWQPIAGKTAIINFDGKWWLSTIVSAKHGKIRARFSGTDHVLDVVPGHVAPEPPYPMDASQHSQAALLRPTSASQAWVHVRLISVDALEAVVEDVPRGRRTVPVRDVCPLENR